MSMYDGYSKAGLIFGNSGGGGGGTTNYAQLTNKPKINGTTIVGDLDADALGLTNSYTYKLVRDEDNNRYYFIDDAGEEIDTADVYSSMIDMALASNALGIINVTFAGFENTNLARLYYTSIDLESDSHGFLFSARENNVLICEKVEAHNVEVIIRDVDFIVRGILTMTSETTATISDLTENYDDIMEAIDNGSNVKLTVVVYSSLAPAENGTIFELNHVIYNKNLNIIEFEGLESDRLYQVIIDESSQDVMITKLQNRYHASAVTLLSSAWTNNTQTVSVEGMVSDALVQVSPVPSDVEKYANAKIICTAQGEGTLTFACGSVPTSNLTVTVVNWG